MQLWKDHNLGTSFWKKKTLESQVAYNKQRNYFTSLLRKEKRSYFENIDTSKISENKIFWKTMKPMFSNKSVNRERITLVKGHKVLSENLEVAEGFNAFFSNISLGQELLSQADQIEDPVLRIIERFKKTP